MTDEEIQEGPHVGVHVGPGACGPAVSHEVLEVLRCICIQEGVDGSILMRLPDPLPGPGLDVLQRTADGESSRVRVRMLVPCDLDIVQIDNGRHPDLNAAMFEGVALHLLPLLPLLRRLRLRLVRAQDATPVGLDGGLDHGPILLDEVHVLCPLLGVLLLLSAFLLHPPREHDLLGEPDQFVGIDMVTVLELVLVTERHPFLLCLLVGLFRILWSVLLGRVDGPVPALDGHGLVSGIDLGPGQGLATVVVVVVLLLLLPLLPFRRRACLRRRDRSRGSLHALHASLFRIHWSVLLGRLDSPVPALDGGHGLVSGIDLGPGQGLATVIVVVVVLLLLPLLPFRRRASLHRRDRSRGSLHASRRPAGVLGNFVGGS